MQRPPLLLSCCLLAACGVGGGGPGSSGTPNTGADLPPELLFCRSRIDAVTADSEISLRTAQNLGTRRVADKSGRELQARLHPDGKRVVFARERSSNDPGSRELFTSSIDGSRSELRLMLNADADDHPCWSPDGGAIVFSSDRSGERRLWRCDDQGHGAVEFVGADAGSSDTEPDWHWPQDRLAFSRRTADGRVRIFLVHGDGSGVVPLTSGTQSASADSRAGDREPAFSPDGSTIVFVRRSEGGGGVLMQVDVGTGAERLLFDPHGDVCLPRYSPRSDRIFLGIDQPLAGRPGLRLSSLRSDGQEPRLLLPDKRLQLDGLDLLPAMPAMPAADAPVLLDTLQAQVQLEAGVRVLGDATMLAEADGAELVLATQTYDGREVAGINCRFALPAGITGEPVAFLVEATLRVTRIDGDTHLRLTLDNPVADRQDTIAEIAPASTAAQTLGFSTISLAHLSRERRLLVGVIAEIGRGARAEMHIDQVKVTVVPRPPAVPLRLQPR